MTLYWIQYFYYFHCDVIFFSVIHLLSSSSFSAFSIFSPGTHTHTSGVSGWCLSLSLFTVWPKAKWIFAWFLFRVYKRDVFDSWWVVIRWYYIYTFLAICSIEAHTHDDDDVRGESKMVDIVSLMLLSIFFYFVFILLWYKYFFSYNVNISAYEYPPHIHSQCAPFQFVWYWLCLNKNDKRRRRCCSFSMHCIAYIYFMMINYSVLLHPRFFCLSLALSRTFRIRVSLFRLFSRSSAHSLSPRTSL